MLRLDGRLDKSRGVVFEDYDFGDFKTVDGIATDPQGNQTAWFKDADGNIHTLVAMPEMPDVKVAAMLAAADLERAKQWYAEKLGFSPTYEYGGEVAVYRSGGGSFSVYRTTFAGTAMNTVGGWEVADRRGRQPPGLVQGHRRELAHDPRGAWQSRLSARRVADPSLSAGVRPGSGCRFVR